MPMESVLHQMPAEAGRVSAGSGEAASAATSDETCFTRCDTGSAGQGSLLTRALARGNMVLAWERVKANRGSAGPDGLSIKDTGVVLKTRWPQIRDELLNGRYTPQPVRRVQIPKPGGGMRELGIPSVTDRLIQQALLQVLQPLIDPTFSEFSYGFRPGRRAHTAVLQAQRYVQDGWQVVVDVDLEKFFDRVNHDVLIDRLRKRIAACRAIRRRWPPTRPNYVHPRTRCEDDRSAKKSGGQVPSGVARARLVVAPQHRPYQRTHALRPFAEGKSRTWSISVHFHRIASRNWASSAVSSS